MRSIIAITTTYAGKKRFVSSLTNRFNNTVSVELSTDPNQAKDFYEINVAKKTVEKIFNPYERVYTVEKIKVKQQVKINPSQTQTWLEARVMK